MVRYAGSLAMTRTAAAACWLTALPQAFAFLVPQTWIITPLPPSPGIRSSAVSEAAAAAEAGRPATSMRFNCLPSSGLVATPSALRDPLLSKRASTAGGGVLSRKPAAISTGDPPLWMSATRVEIDEDKVPGGGDASTAILADDFDVKKDLMDQINLASSSKKRCTVL